MPRKGPPYIVIEADSPLDQRWDAGLWFAWSRLLGQCRLKRACTTETWPAAVLKLRTIQAAAILAVHPNKVRWCLDRLAIVSSMSSRCERDHAGDVWTITIDNYAKYQKLGRPTSDRKRVEVSDPPHVPTSPRPHEEEEQSRAAPPPAVATAPERPLSVVADAHPKPAQRKPAAAPPPEWAVTASKDLAVAVRRRWPGAIVPGSFVGWARKLAGIRAPAAEVQELVAWYAAPALDGPGGGLLPYTPEARSGAAIAAKWNQLVSARQRAQGSRGASGWAPGARIPPRSVFDRYAKEN